MKQRDARCWQSDGLPCRQCSFTAAEGSLTATTKYGGNGSECAAACPVHTRVKILGVKRSVVTSPLAEWRAWSTPLTTLSHINSLHSPGRVTGECPGIQPEPKRYQTPSSGAELPTGQLCNPKVLGHFTEIYHWTCQHALQFQPYCCTTDPGAANRWNHWAQRSLKLDFTFKSQQQAQFYFTNCVHMLVRDDQLQFDSMFRSYGSVHFWYTL